MDPYEVYYPRETRNLCSSPANGVCSAPDTRWNNFRDTLGAIVGYSRRLNLSNVIPQPGLSSTGYCLAQTPSTGAEYLIYAPLGGSFTVNLSATRDTLNVEWFNPSTGAVIAGGTVAGGSTSRSFTTPFSGDAVLYLVDAAGHGGGGTTQTTYVDTSVIANTTYSYRVRAVDTSGNLSQYSTSASATTPGSSGDSQSPTTPGGLTAQAAGSSQIDLAWAASTDNVGVTGYRIERCQGTGCTSFLEIAGTTGTGTVFSNSGLSSNTTYSYRVRAADAAGNLSGYSGVASATTASTISSLVAAYSFNEGTGTTVTDLSGNGNTGTIVGAAWTTAAKYGKALSFNGTTSYVDLGNPASLQFTGSMTWSAWTNATGTPSDDGQIIAKSDNASGWQLKTSPDTGSQTFGIAVSGTGAPRTQRYSSTVRSLNTWYHVAGVYNASARTLDIYVNGVLNNGVLVGTIPSLQVSPNVNVNIGRRTGGLYFNGIIDEVRIYNRALTQAEIQADMNTPLGGGAPSPPAVSLSSSNLDFGGQQTGITSAAKTVTLTNSGGATLTISSIAVSGVNSSDFTQSSNCGTSVPSAGTCTISVTFKPTVIGPRSATVTIHG